MSVPQEGFGGILATDQYQLTMAQLYWKEDLSDRAAQFDYFFRSYPDYGTHQAGYCICSKLGRGTKALDDIVRRRQSCRH